MAERYNVVASIAEEIETESRLKSLLENVPNPVAYDGFEPSGRVHLAQGLMKARIVNQLTSNGFTFVFWVADLYAQLNEKFGGDLKKIQTVGRYMMEVWKAAGMDLTNVEFQWASEEIGKRHTEHQQLTIQIASNFTLDRVKRCCTIMGKENPETLKASQIIYPCMQAADIFFIRTQDGRPVNVCQLGLDQRKVNTLALDFAQKVKCRPPVILSHHMISGLLQGQTKMSKSMPDTAIFCEDSEADVNRKIKHAWCPPDSTDNSNPIFDILRHIVFPIYQEHSPSTPLHISRKDEYGDDLDYISVDQLSDDFLKGEIHPDDVKKATANAINQLLQPIRDHFKINPEAKALLSKVKQYRK